VIHSDLPEPEVREARVRMTKVAEEYFVRLPGSSAKVEGRLPFYLYANAPDYRKAGGAENSAGSFDGERLMALTLRRDDGVISLSTWHVVQHEAFHQFAHVALRGRLPMWAEEGLAEYFGEGLFTGDGFETGLIPPARLGRIREMLREGQNVPLREFRGIPRERWNERVEMRNYDQAWSFVHFLMHGEQGRLQPALATYLKEIAAGEDEPETAYNRYLNSIPDLEKRWRAWWLGLADAPTAHGYARATVAMLTSFLARAEVMGQRFETFAALAKTPAEQIRQAEEDWLPPTLFAIAVAESAKLRRRGAEFTIDRGVLVLLMADGTRVEGRFKIEGGRVREVRAEVVKEGATTRRAATRALDAEMLR
jgi:hypothetical protein